MSHHAPTVPMRMLVWDLQEMGLSPSNVLNDKKLSSCRVLTTLLKNEKIPDPFYGLNNEEVPDIADVGPDYYTFWFCNQFDLPTLVSSCN